MYIKYFNLNSFIESHLEQEEFTWNQSKILDLSIALTDTYGTDFFFKEGFNEPHKWKGLRQDSGDPFKFVDKTVLIDKKRIENYNQIKRT